MDTVYRLQCLVFEWDQDKAQSNIEKHGVTFEEAAEAFFDPFYQPGDASTEDEQREKTNNARRRTTRLHHRLLPCHNGSC